MSAADGKPALQLLWHGDVHARMRLELATDLHGKRRTLATIVAAADESLWVEVERDGDTTRFPLAELKDAIAAAERDVHPDRWQDLRDVLGDADA